MQRTQGTSANTLSVAPYWYVATWQGNVCDVVSSSDETETNKISTSPHRRSRFLLGSIPIPGGQIAQGKFEISNVSVSRNIEGSIQFRQNLLTGQNSSYTAHIKGTGMENEDYYIGMDVDCSGKTFKVRNKSAQYVSLILGTRGYLSSLF